VVGFKIENQLDDDVLDKERIAEETFPELTVDGLKKDNSPGAVLSLD
jgi:hypothetical protein